MNITSQVIAALTGEDGTNIEIGSASLTVAGQTVVASYTTDTYVAIGSVSLSIAGQALTYIGGTRIVEPATAALTMSGQGLALKTTVSILNAALVLSGSNLNAFVTKPYGLGFTPASSAPLESKDLSHDPCGHWHNSPQAGEQIVFDFTEQGDKRWNWFDGSWNKFKTGG